MKNFETVRVFGVITVPDIRRNDKHASEFCVYALIFYIMPPASVCNDVYFVKGMIVHKNRENLSFVMEKRAANKVFRVILENELVCVEPYIV